MVNIDRVLDWMTGFIDTLSTQLETTGNYCGIADLHTLQFTVVHALGFSVFTSRILATDLSQSYCNFKSHMKTFWFLSYHFFSITLDCHLQNSMQFTITNCSLGTSRYTASGRTQVKHCLLLSRIVLGVLTAPLRSNRRPIVARIGSRGNVFTEYLPSKGSIRHNILHILSSTT
jgi:hypothetical protein